MTNILCFHCIGVTALSEAFPYTSKLRISHTNSQAFYTYSHFSKSVNDGFNLPFTKWAYLIYWIMPFYAVTALFHPIPIQGASFLLQCLFRASPSFTLHGITQQHPFWKDKERKYPDWDTWPKGHINRLSYYYPTEKCTTPLLWLESLLLWVQWKNNQCSRNSFS